MVISLSRTERKWDHIRLALEKQHESRTGFDDIKFIHQSLPDISVSDVRLDHSFGGLSLSSPIFINAMTGGGGEKTYQINKKLAQIAESKGLAMAVGSQMAALKDKNERYTFDIVRKENPRGVIFANLGSEATVDQAKLAIDMLEANALQIHLNVIQELIMPEGDRDFTGALKRIESIVKKVKVPVIVKEVGFGMSFETVQALVSVGVAAVDIGGAGGTNFAQIENKRRTFPLSFFNEWGIPTAVSIIEASQSSENVYVMATGGFKTALDIAKGIALGANCAGIAGTFIRILLNEGEEALMAEIDEFHNALTMIMTALGTRTIKELQNAPVMISGETYHWLNQRGIDTKLYSRQTKR
jgi:isopentenyl-diphosphate delta-isomerase